MNFSIIPHTANELLAEFTMIYPLSVSDKVFYSICILNKPVQVPTDIADTDTCLFLFYEYTENTLVHRTWQMPLDFNRLSYVDVGTSSLCHILTQLSKSCPDLYPLLESQYQLVLTQRFLETLQNGYHIRMRDLLQAISSNLEKKVLVIEPTMNQTDMMSSTEFFDQLPEHSQVIGHLDQNPVYLGKILRKDMGTCLIIPIYRFGEIIEFLIVGNCRDTPYPLFYSALKTVISALAIEYEMRQSVFTVVNRSRNGLMDAITNSGRLNPATITEWAGLLGFKAKRLYIVIYLDFISSDKQKKVGMSVYYEILEFMIHYYHPDDYYFLRSSSDSLYMIGQFSPDSPETAQKKSIATCQQIEHLLKTKSIVKKMYSGIGTTQQQISDISKSYEDALKALKIAHTTGESIICYETLGILRLLGNIPAKEAADSYVPACLKQLQQYDRKNNTNLVGTLTAYYSANCNASQAAKTLFIHYKTMLNRLERIAQILDCDYNDSHIRLEIEMGLQIIHMHHCADE